jgi:hypothetical protein
MKTNLTEKVSKFWFFLICLFTMAKLETNKKTNKKQTNKQKTQ